MNVHMWHNALLACLVVFHSSCCLTGVGGRESASPCELTSSPPLPLTLLLFPTPHPLPLPYPRLPPHPPPLPYPLSPPHLPPPLPYPLFLLTLLLFSSLCPRLLSLLDFPLVTHNLKSGSKAPNDSRRTAESIMVSFSLRPPHKSLGTRLGELLITH